MSKKETVAIGPGSFDPITNGHIYVVKEARKLYDKVYVAVMINNEKNYTFSLEERKEIAAAALAELSDVSVISYNGWLYELVNELNADVIVKGYRNDIDLEYEQKMAEFNQLHTNNVQTVLIRSSVDLMDVSSTLAREKISSGEDLVNILPVGAIKAIERILNARSKKSER